MLLPALIFLGLGLLWAAAYPFADYYGRFKASVLRRADHPFLVGLTFDDGPDPVHTPEILAILRRFGAKATFFLVGRQAAKHPEIVRQIEQEGHEVALHSFSHRHAYTLLFGTEREVSAGLAAVRTVAGTRPQWFRPPWGAFNIFLLPAVRRNGLKPVLWSVNADDWLRATGPDGIRRLVRERVHPGAIIVLHDHGGEAGAPENTVRALPGILSDLARRGLRPVSLSTLCREGGTACQV